ncbi:actin-binding LIM protein 2 isoform X16 [Delphinapterus leucas]|uniref:Actin-binding LIM protein 2 isoform X16 n=1 Tax=Delphinapterus leucas TaxID=9749 RepID=A0A2Y9LZ29_DELLE|nr:actin-binding LIM protein 2 isoform X16 [Delphinapterus leucas]
MPAATRIWTGREGSSRRAQREPCPADTWISAQWYRLWTSGFQNCCLTSLCWFVTTATRNEYTSEQTTPKRRGRTRQSVFLAGGLRAGRGSANQARLRGGGSAPSPTLLLGPAGGRSTVGQREPPSAWTQNWNIVTSTRVPWPSQPHEPAQRGDPGEVSEPQAARSAPEKPASTAILCNTCGNVCRGEVLRVQSKYFHIQCFVCKECGCDLAEGGFFVRQGEYICTQDYQRLYGTRCFSCDQFIEGEVVSALGKTYHPNCFVCAVCRLPFPPGDRVTFNGKECMCQKCSLPTSAGSSVPLSQGLWSCKGCGVEIKNGQSLVALEKHWHLGCFKCKTCGKQLNAEYISKDGLPYCEADYHSKFGIRCDGCEKYITGHVLEAGEKHFHPLCALCVGCGRMFAEGEEMYLQGSSIWHPACRQAARTEDKSKETRTSSESIISVPASSTSGSPSRVIYAKLGDEILDYRDLAALPKNKAIYSIDRPDMISYSPFISHSVGDRQSCSESPRLLSPTPPEGYQDDRSYKQCRTSSPSSTGSVSLGRYTPTLRSPQHYSRPAGRRSDGEDGSFDADNRKQKTNWLLLKGDGDTRTNSPDLDSQSLAHSSGTDRGPLQTMPGDNIYSRFPYSKSDPVPGHGKNGLDHRVGTGPARPPQHMRTNGHRELGWLPQLGDHTARRTGPGDPAHPPTSACCSTQGQTTTRQHPSSPLLPAPSPQGDLSVGGQGQRGHPEESDPL